jgi:hypothetical protein
MLHTFRTVTLLLAVAVTNACAGVLLETASMDRDGIAYEELQDSLDVRGLNLNGARYQGVRFELTEPVVISEIGGHFLRKHDAPENDMLFAALIAIDGSHDYPDSPDLSTPDVLGVTLFELPTASADVFGPLPIRIGPGWYAVVYGAELFGAGGIGASILGSTEFNSPSYFTNRTYETPWINRDDDDLFRGVRFVIRGYVIPEPTSSTLTITAGAIIALATRRES